MRTVVKQDKLDDIVKVLTEQFPTNQFPTLNSDEHRRISLNILNGMYIGLDYSKIIGFYQEAIADQKLAEFCEKPTSYINQKIGERRRKSDEEMERMERESLRNSGIDGATVDVHMWAKNRHLDPY